MSMSKENIWTSKSSKLWKLLSLLNFIVILLRYYIIAILGFVLERFEEMKERMSERFEQRPEIDESGIDLKEFSKSVPDQ